MRLLMKPFQLGPYELSHRVVMAPLTRLRASGNGIVHPLAATYYGQRASSGGLLITEATSAASNGNGYLGAPGIYDDRQIAPWRDVVKAVHAKGGRIFMQLYHAGRRSHADVQPDRVRPVGPSEVVHGSQALTEAGWVPNTPNRALRLDEMPAIVEQFRLAAARALAAGFDGVELHGANGYLFDQFMQDNSNLRRDSYGGSIANRVRLLLETAQAVSTVAGNARVGVRLSPSGRVGDMADSDPQALFSHVATSLARLDLAYLHLIEPRMQGTALATATGAPEQPVAAALLRPTTQAPSLSPAVSSQPAPRRSCSRAMPIWSPLAVTSSPIPTCRRAFATIGRWRPTTVPRSMGARLPATPTIQLLSIR